MQKLAAGLIWGGVAGIAGLAVLSELTPVPLTLAGRPAPATGAAAAPDPRTEPATPPLRIAASPEGAVRPLIGAVDVPAGSEFARPLPDADPLLPARSGAPSGTVPSVLPAPETTAAPPLADRVSASRPVMSAAAPPMPQGPDLASPESTPRDLPATLPATLQENPPGNPRGNPPAHEGLPQGTSPPSPPARPAPDAAPTTAAPPPARSTPAGPAAILPEEFGPPPPEPDPDPAPARMADRVVTNRLPRIGDGPRAEVGEAAVVDARDRRPIDRFARPFDNPDGKPALAILLIDAGDPGLDRDALARLPFAISFVIDPLAPGASDQAAIYRSAGQEVVMLATGIPAGAAPTDLEVTFAALAATIPEAVAVLDLATGGFQTNRPLATQVVPILKDQGRGLISWDQGLNAADQVARREGVPSVVVFRSIEAAGTDPAEIRRALDRAVFRATQTGQAAVAGSASPETVAALLEWTAEGRAASVALAPVTALMTGR